MEGLSVNLDALLMQEERTIGEMSIKHYRFPDVPQGTYRLFFADGTYQDVQAENASNAFQLAEREDIVRIVNLKFAYTHILERDVIHASGEEIKPSLAHDAAAAGALLSVEIETLQHGTFEMLDLTEFAALRKTSV